MMSKRWLHWLFAPITLAIMTLTTPSFAVETGGYQVQPDTTYTLNYDLMPDTILRERSWPDNVTAAAAAIDKGIILVLNSKSAASYTGVAESQVKAPIYTGNQMPYEVGWRHQYIG